MTKPFFFFSPFTVCVLYTQAIGNKEWREVRCTWVYINFMGVFNAGNLPWQKNRCHSLLKAMLNNGNLMFQ